MRQNFTNDAFLLHTNTASRRGNDAATDTEPGEKGFYLIDHSRATAIVDHLLDAVDNGSKDNRLTEIESDADDDKVLVVNANVNGKSEYRHGMKYINVAMA